MVQLLVQNGACIFATTFSDHETAAEKCEEDEVGYDECYRYLSGKKKRKNLSVTHFSNFHPSLLSISKQVSKKKWE